MWVWAWFSQNFNSYHLSVGIFFKIQEPLGLVQLSSKVGSESSSMYTVPNVGPSLKIGPEFSSMLPTFRKNSNFLLKKTWKMCSRVSFESFGSRSSKRLLVPLFGSCANSHKWPLIWVWVIRTGTWPLSLTMQAGPTCQHWSGCKTYFLSRTSEESYNNIATFNVNVFTLGISIFLCKL